MTVDDPELTRLRTTLATVAARHEPDPGAWARICQELDAPAAVTPLPQAVATHRRGRTLLAAAAVIALLALAAGVIRSARAEDTRITTTPAGDPTGWYVPVGLPDGWQVRSVTVDRMDQRCPCRTTVWTDPERDVSVSAVSEALATVDDGITVDGGPPPTTFALPGGIEAELNAPPEYPDSWDVSWEADGQRQSISGWGVPVDQAEEVARAIAADPATDTIPVPGVSVLASWSEASAVGKEVDVNVSVGTPAGHVVEYTLSSARRFTTNLGFLRPTDALADRQPLPLLAEDTEGTPREGRIRDYLGQWPGATVRVLPEFENGGTATDAELADLTASLRPADLATWRRFVADAANRDRTVTASATLADLIEGRPSAAAPRDPAEATGDFGDLEVTLSADPQLASWLDANAQLTVRNPTESPITDATCALDHARIALLPAGPTTRARVGAIPGGSLWWSDDGPCDGGTTIAPGATKTVRLVTRAQFHDSRYGPLPSGSYRATVEVAGIDSPITAPITISAEDCAPTALGFLGQTEGDARAEAARLGYRSVLVPEPGTDSQVSVDRCDRLNLVLGPDGRVVYARAY